MVAQLIFIDALSSPTSKANETYLSCQLQSLTLATLLSFFPLLSYLLSRHLSC